MNVWDTNDTNAILITTDRNRYTITFEDKTGNIIYHRWIDQSDS
jgi:hypothetical protein